MTDYAKMHEMRTIIDEKNKIIEDLRFLITEKDHKILDLETKLKIVENTALLATSTLGKPVVITSPSSTEASVLGHSSHHHHHHHQTLSNEHKDELIKELFFIITHQLDWRKVQTNNIHLQKVLTPTVGKYRFDDGDYEGDLLAGVPNGQGRTNLDNGDQYTGQYLHGKKSDIGIYRYNNGDVYEGSHIEGLESGKGVYRFANGDCYVGDFLNGRRHGFGILKLADGTLEHGHFLNGQYNGKCIMVSPDEQVVSIGDLKDNKQEGDWKFYDFGERALFVAGIKV